MKITFSSGQEFLRQFKRLSKKYKSLVNDIIVLRNDLLENPDQGTDLGNGVHKIRMAIASKGKGKSGGARVLTLNVLLDESTDKDLHITFLTIYDKSEISNVSESYIEELVSSINSPSHDQPQTDIQPEDKKKASL